MSKKFRKGDEVVLQVGHLQKRLIKGVVKGTEYETGDCAVTFPGKRSGDLLYRVSVGGTVLSLPEDKLRAFTGYPLVWDAN